jgi:hypothetical protein
MENCYAVYHIPTVQLLKSASAGFAEKDLPKASGRSQDSNDGSAIYDKFLMAHM